MTNFNYLTPSKIVAARYHDISAGHRVVGHEGKCAHLHGHNYRITFHCSAEHLDDIGRVLDFGVIKERLCMWLEREWDHKFVVWEQDPMSVAITRTDPDGVVVVPFNPTAENMADFLLRIVCPLQLHGTGVRVVRVVVEETRKCAAEASHEF
jgi:6-pyruvoyltetrahydropterin/6-carboxytetrahydropterin synthase